MSEMTLEQLESLRDTVLETISSECSSGAYNMVSNAFDVAETHLTRAPVQVTDDAIKVLDEHHQALLSAGNFTGEGPWFSNGEEMAIKEEYAQARASLSARLAQPVDEGKQQWDELASILGAHGDNVDEVFRKAREAMAQSVVASFSDDAIKAAAQRAIDVQSSVPRDISPGDGWEWMVRKIADALLSQPHPQATQRGEAQEEAVGEYLANVDAHGGVRWINGKPPHGTKLYTHPVERAAVPEGWNPTDAEVRTWMERNDLDNQHLSQMRIAIDDARSMHLLSAAPPLAGKEKG